MGLLDSIRGADFTGLNRALGRGKHHGELDGEERGIAGGIPSRRATASAEEESVKLTLIVRGLQTFFLLISLFINIALAVFQSSNNVGPSGLVGLTFFVVIVTLLCTVILLVLLAFNERSGAFKGAMRIVRQLRVAVVVAAAQSLLLLIIALAATISANTNGCKDASMDAHADNKDYLTKLPDFCRNRRALAAFLWFSCIAWLVSLVICLRQWRDIRKNGPRGAAFKPPGHEAGYSNATAFDDSDPAFDPPDENDDLYDDRPAMSYAQSRPSGTFMTGERAPFDDPLPSGYQPASANRHSNPFADTHAGAAQPPAYVDPYERIRANYQLDESGPPTSGTMPYSGGSGNLSDAVR